MTGLMTLFFKSVLTIWTARTNPVRPAERERESQKRIKSPCAAAASIYITLVNRGSKTQSLIKYRSDQVKRTKWADSWIPWERSVFVLHARTFRSLFFLDCENVNIHTCGGALDGFIFKSSFPHYTRFNALVSVLNIIILNLRTI